MHDSDPTSDAGPCDPFDFDEWSSLYQRDPAEFERRRKALLDDALAAAGPERRAGLVALLERFDATAGGLAPHERAHAATMLAVESLQTLGDELASLAAKVDGTSSSERGPTPARHERAASRPRSRGKHLLH